MREQDAKDFLKSSLDFSDIDIEKLEIFRKHLLEYNKKYNLISKNTEDTIWNRHILDSAQLLRFIDTRDSLFLADFGTGAGFPGLIISIFNKNTKFHVKLYEKSPVKREFLNIIKKKLDLSLEIDENVYKQLITADILVIRAFKKIDEIIKISRENVRKPHKIIILKGKNAQKEINNVSLESNYSYKIESSITDNDSKIIIINAKKNEP